MEKIHHMTIKKQYRILDMIKDNSKFYLEMAIKNYEMVDIVKIMDNVKDKINDCCFSKYKTYLELHEMEQKKLKKQLEEMYNMGILYIEESMLTDGELEEYELLDEELKEMGDTNIFGDIDEMEQLNNFDEEFKDTKITTITERQLNNVKNIRRFKSGY